MYIIAEVGQAHDGSLGIAHSYIDALKDTGVDAIKFQTHIADAESSIHEPFRVKFSYEDDKRIDYWRRMEFTVEQWSELKKHCEAVGKEFISSPFSNAAVDLLEKVGVKKYKVGSGEVNNFLMLEKIAKTGKPVIISSGLSSFEELDRTYEFLKKRSVEFSILQCTTSYPTKPDQWGLNLIQEMKERYNVPIGFSDHSGDIYACLSAANMGADVLEFHVVFDKKIFGPDSKASLTFDNISRLIKGVHQIELAQNTKNTKNKTKEVEDLKVIFEKSLSVNKTIQKGGQVKFSDLEAKKPKGYGINANKYTEIIGKKVNRTVHKGEFLNFKDLFD